LLKVRVKRDIINNNKKNNNNNNDDTTRYTPIVEIFQRFNELNQNTNVLRM